MARDTIAIALRSSFADLLRRKAETEAEGRTFYPEITPEQQRSMEQFVQDRGAPVRKKAPL